jgi:hypothetical protein
MKQLNLRGGFALMHPAYSRGRSAALSERLLSDFTVIANRAVAARVDQAGSGQR